jgi:sterol desaturase/sphingolipid hydroxylase (fatty acid hydroxylase superfamily)
LFLEGNIGGLMSQEATWFDYSFWLEGHYLAITAATFALLMVAERVYYAVYLPKKYPDMDSLSSLATGLLARGIRMVMDVFILFTLYIWVFDNIKLFDFSNSYWGFLVGFILHDLAWYWQHRIKHRVGFFWAIHQVHHSSNTYTIPVSQRASFANRLLRSPIFAIIALAGVSPLQFTVIIIFTNFWGIFVHTNAIGKMGWLEGVLITPSAHRVHHGAQAHYIDKNYGEILCLWDRIFGTYQREDVPVDFGLVTPLTTLNPIKIQLAGFAWLWCRVVSAPTWRGKLNYLWRPAEWRHTASIVSDDNLKIPRTETLN